MKFVQSLSLNLLLVALLASHGTATRHSRASTNSNERRLDDPAVRGYVVASPRRSNNYVDTTEGPRHVSNQDVASHGNHGFRRARRMGSIDYSRKEGQSGRYLMGGHSHSKSGGQRDDIRTRSKLGKRDAGVHSGEGRGRKGDGNALAGDVLPTAPPTTTTTTTLAPVTVATVSKPPTLGTTTVEPTGPAADPTTAPTTTTTTLAPVTVTTVSKPPTIGTTTIEPAGPADGATFAPTTSSSLTPEQIACEFLSYSSLTDCRATDSAQIYYNTSGSTIPSEIGVLTQLTHLNLAENFLTGSIPSSISSLTKLTILNFGYNNLTGTIPSSLSSLTQLTFLAFGGNQLTGSIPSSLSSLTQLTFLDFSGSGVSGSIPSSLSGLTQLWYLSFSSNRLTGTIPASFSYLTTLLTFSVSNNELTGSIPSSFSSLAGMEYLYLDGNRLTGTIPSFLSSFTKVMWLDLSNNELSGSIPSSLCDQWYVLDIPTGEFAEGRLEIAIDCGEIECSCCYC